MDNYRSEQNEAIVKAAGLGIFMGCFFLLIAYLSVSPYGVRWPWWPGIFGTLVCALSALVLLPIGLIGRRAYQFQAIVGVMFAGWILPLLAAGFEMTSWSLAQVAWIVLLCSANGVISYRSAMRRLTASPYENVKAGRLDIKAGLWNISRPLFPDANKEAGQNLARLLMPLASGIGAILYRVLPGQESWLYAALLYVMAFLLVMVPAMHIAAAVYLVRLEGRLRITISI